MCWGSKAPRRSKCKYIWTKGLQRVIKLTSGHISRLLLVIDSLEAIGTHTYQVDTASSHTSTSQGRTTVPKPVAASRTVRNVLWNEPVCGILRKTVEVIDDYTLSSLHILKLSEPLGGLQHLSVWAERMWTLQTEGVGCGPCFFSNGSLVNHALFSGCFSSLSVEPGEGDYSLVTWVLQGCLALSSDFLGVWGRETHRPHRWVLSSP